MRSTRFSCKHSFSPEKKNQKELQTRLDTGGDPPSAPGSENAAQTGGVGQYRSYLTILKKDLSRFWPLWAAYTLLWFLLIPMNLLSRAQQLAREYAALGQTGWAGDLAMQEVCAGGRATAFVYGVLCAMAVWSYLFNARSAQLTHALPVRREGLFTAHLLSGVTMFVLPHGIVLVLTALAGLATGSRGDLAWIAAAMGTLTLLCLFFFALATLCAFMTGHIVALPALYLVANFLVYSLAYLLDWLFGKFLFGVSSTLVDHPAVRWCYPLLHMTEALGFRLDFRSGNFSGTATGIKGIPTPADGLDGPLVVTRRLEGLPVVLIYAAAGLVLAALALALYRRRNLESAGDVIAVGWMKPVFQYGVAFVAALAGTWMTVDILGANSPALIALLLAGWGVIGFFAARMLLQKSLRVFKSGWKGGLATAAVLLLLCGGLWTDALGLERQLPDPAQVESVYLRGPESVPVDGASWCMVDVTDPALIEKVISLHRAAIEHRQEQKALQGETLPEGMRNTLFNVTYTLKNGQTLERRYDLVLDLSQGEEPGTVAGAAKALIGDRDFIRMAYGLDHVDPSHFTQVIVEGLSKGEGCCSPIHFYAPLSGYVAEQFQDTADAEKYVALPADTVEAGSGDDREWRDVTAAELTELWQAVLADIDAGDLGNRWLNWSDEGCEENVTAVTLMFCWQVKSEDPEQPNYFYTEEMTIQLDRRGTHTWRALEELGVFEGGVYAGTVSGERVYPR